ncbi:hypothetical protein [Mahella australiensis]|uniref:Glycosyl transferase family 2 n=1 Tax=Mahella australiensis (strain DSM 15567 / CIP 107919 / 50-1 BON) TaxID=697281 RepID=F3ZVW0_MAHA5|nr:hypothetical protein [Mahella australiensis]AEE95334.1 hypothetical protein Mahau_0111 [Mahella australiensis 50-1 BON]
MSDTLRIALIPAYKPEPILVDLAGQLKAQGMQVVVVDDGSGKEYKRTFAATACYVTIIWHGKNQAWLLNSHQVDNFEIKPKIYR